MTLGILYANEFSIIPPFRMIQGISKPLKIKPYFLDRSRTPRPCNHVKGMTAKSVYCSVKTFERREHCFAGGRLTYGWGGERLSLPMGHDHGYSPFDRVLGVLLFYRK